MPKAKDYTGLKVGNLIALESTDIRKDGRIVWRFKCLNCGNKNYLSSPKVVMSNYKMHGVANCGCVNGKGINSHGLSDTKFYYTWNNMIRRCEDENNKEYHNYGGRGIKVCEKWCKFKNFMKDMYKSYTDHIDKYGEEGTTIERIDVNCNYEPNNCTWATFKEQAKNKRRSGPQKLFKAISPEGKEYFSNNQVRFAEEHNLSSDCISNCLNPKRKHYKHRGWKFEYIAQQ